MKFSRLLRKALIALSLAGMATTFGGQSATAATESANLAVSADVQPSCIVTTSAVAFGSYDPLATHTAGNPLDGAGSVTITCASGLPVTIRLGQSSPAVAGSTDASPTRAMTGPTATDKLSYNLYTDLAHTDVWGNTTASGVADTGTGAADVTPIYGLIPGGQNVASGLYNDTVVAAVDF